MARPGIWTEEEHDRFLVAIRQYPNGPWTAIADAVGTRSVRQVQTHTQKYYEKILRRMDGSRTERKSRTRNEHRIEDDIADFCAMGSVQRPAERARGGAPTAALPVELFRGASPGERSELTQWLVARTTLHREELDEMRCTIVFNDDDDDDDDDNDNSRLPSLEESLDFFLKALEVEVEVIS